MWDMPRHYCYCCDQLIQQSQFHRFSKMQFPEPNQRFMTESHFDDQLLLPQHSYNYYAPQELKQELFQSDFYQQKMNEQEEPIPPILEKCPICYEDYDLNYLLSIADCSHHFCQSCIDQYMTSRLKGFSKIKCLEDGCEKELDTQSKYYKNLSPEKIKAIQKMFTQYEIIKNPKLKPCQVQSCIGKFNIDPPEIKCDICATRHCPKCFLRWHDGVCDKRMAIDLETNRKFRRCKKCGQVIEKSDGCTHMTCACGHYFCYSCGQTLEGEHKCVIPQELNCLQKMRWQIQHIELFYESNLLNFLKCMVCVQPQIENHCFAKFLWLIIYILLIYPFTIVLGLIGIAIFIFLLVFAFIIFTLIQPIINVCNPNNFNMCPIPTLVDNCGHCITLIIVLVFYPIFYVLNLIQFIGQVLCEHRDNLGEFCQIFVDVGNGMRNILIMPCIMLVSNKQYYEKNGNLEIDDNLLK